MCVAPGVTGALVKADDSCRSSCQCNRRNPFRPAGPEQPASRIVPGHPCICRSPRLKFPFPTLSHGVSKGLNELAAVFVRIHAVAISCSGSEASLNTVRGDILKQRRLTVVCHQEGRLVQIHRIVPDPDLSYVGTCSGVSCIDDSLLRYCLSASCARRDCRSNRECRDTKNLLNVIAIESYRGASGASSS